MKIEDMTKLMEAVSKYGIEKFSYEYENEKICISKKRGVGVKLPESSQVLSDVEEFTDTELQSYSTPDKVITSPLVGTFYAAASPDAEPYVSIGDSVKKGQIVGIVEAMKLMNEIESDVDGVVEAILIDDASIVEYGQALFRIK